MKESDIQKTVVEYLRLKGILFTISPAGLTIGDLKTRCMISRHSKKMGYTKGTPDIIVFNACGGSSGLLIELKTKTGRQTPEQKEFESKATYEGYTYKICRSVEETMEAIDKYLEGK